MPASNDRTLIKTDKTIKFDPRNLITLYRFAKYYMNWDPTYLQGPAYLYIGDSIYEGFQVETILLPTYMTLPVPSAIRDLFKPKHSDIIDIKNFSYFDFYKVVKVPDGRLFSVSFNVDIRQRVLDKAVGFDSLSMHFDYFNKGSLSSRIFIASFDLPTADERSIEASLKSLMDIQGVSYSDLESSYPEYIKRRLILIEETLTVLLNFIHFLYTYEFETEKLASQMLKKYSDLIKGFGCEFENMLPKLTAILSLAYGE
jgi:Uri superfamily endonuclease